MPCLNRPRASHRAAVELSSEVDYVVPEPGPVQDQFRLGSVEIDHFRFNQRSWTFGLFPLVGQKKKRKKLRGWLSSSLRVALGQEPNAIAGRAANLGDFICPFKLPTTTTTTTTIVSQQRPPTPLGPQGSPSRRYSDTFIRWYNHTRRGRDIAWDTYA